MKKFARLRGWLTKDDIRRLEEASARPVKQRTYHERWRCSACDYLIFYQTARCPLCNSELSEIR